MDRQNIKTKKRILFVFALFCIALVVLAFRSGYWQIIKGEELKDRAVTQQTNDSVVEAKRGIIYDRNGMELAVSGTVYSVWIRPTNIAQMSDEKQDELVTGLSQILGISEKELRGYIAEDKALKKIAKGIDKDTADKLNEKGYRNVELSEEKKRYYPMGAFASQLLGNVSDDNMGLAGIEQYYDRTLTGIAGRSIQSSDVAGYGLSYGIDEYYEASNGADIVLTIDEVVQNYVEQAIKDTKKDTGADRVMAMVMNPENGEILAMAVTPGYDPNNARTPASKKDRQALAKMNDKEEMEFLNKMWRNPLVQDTYEPGSTFKLMTLAMIYEENLSPKGETFYDSGKINVNGIDLHCWSDTPHGQQKIAMALANSCNPVFAKLGLRIGKNRFYNYLSMFGYDTITGIDFPGEAGAILQDKDAATSVDLATMAYGQGIAVTPIQLMTAVSAIGNDGVMMQPHLVKEIRDTETGEVTKTKIKTVRQILSKQTAKQLCNDMVTVVENSGTKLAKVPGYKIGGKTGTANKPDATGYSDETNSSFIGMAPMDDPKVEVLVIVDNPKGIKYGSVVAGPCAHDIFANILPHLGIEEKYTGKEAKEAGKDTVKVPNVEGKSYKEAKSILNKAGLNIRVQKGDSKSSKFRVKDQYPAAGNDVQRKSRIYVYGE